MTAKALGLRSAGGIALLAVFGLARCHTPTFGADFARHMSVHSLESGRHTDIRAGGAGLLPLHIRL